MAIFNTNCYGSISSVKIKKPIVLGNNVKNNFNSNRTNNRGKPPVKVQRNLF